MLAAKELVELHSDPYVINVKNGLYNVLGDSLRQHTPEYLLPCG
jgi:putative DNA primase/helicase